MIARPAGRRMAGRIPEALGQLGAQRGLEHTPGELGQAPRARDLVRPQPLWRVLQRVIGQQPREPLSSLVDGTRARAGRDEPSSWIFISRGHDGVPGP